MKLHPFAYLGLLALLTYGCGSSDNPATPGGSAGAGGGDSGAMASGGSSGSSGSSGSAGASGASGSAGKAGAAGTTGDASATPGGSGTVSGTVNGVSFSKILTAWWIGKPSAGGAPTQIYVSDVALKCSDITAAGWDHLLGTGQLIELDLADSAPKKYVIGTDLDASYVKDPYNPSATAGSVTITKTNAGKNIVGSYDLTFASSAGDAGGDQVTGTFDAAYCADGVEP
jgi:hypothetical protein